MSKQISPTAIYDDSGRYLAELPANVVLPPVPLQYCEHGILCNDCRSNSPLPTSKN